MVHRNVLHHKLAISFSVCERGHYCHVCFTEFTTELPSARQLERQQGVVYSMKLSWMTEQVVILKKSGKLYIG